MRKKVIVLVSLLFVLVDMYAQTFYYDTTQVLTSGWKVKITFW